MLRDTRPIVWLKAARRDFEAFRKKSKTGIKTPKQELDLIDARLRRVKEMLK
jgi:hypothetical protein